MCKNVFCFKILCCSWFFFFLFTCLLSQLLIPFLRMPLECYRLFPPPPSSLPTQSFNAYVVFYVSFLAALSVASPMRLQFTPWCYLPSLHRNKSHWLSYISALIFCSVWTILREWRIRDTDPIWLGSVMPLSFKKQGIHWIRISNSWHNCSLVGCDRTVVLLINSNRNRREPN